MQWSVELLDKTVEAELEALSPDLRASFLRITELIESMGLYRIREPYVKHLEGPLWEIRMRGQDGIARAAYVTASGRRVIVVRVFPKEDAEDATEGNRTRVTTRQGCAMSRTSIPVKNLASKWMKDPEFRKAYDALEDEFTLARALIAARTDARLTQEQLANAMGTTQAVIARLESGRAKPSTRTLQRFAEATGTRLTIRFERVPGQEPVDTHS